MASPAEKSEEDYQKRKKLLIERIKAALPQSISVNGEGLLWYRTPTIDKVLGLDPITYDIRGAATEIQSMIKSISIWDLLEVTYKDESKQP